MSFFHPIYINNNTNIVIKEDKNYFEKYDVDSLDSLKYTNEFIKSIITNFQAHKWKNKYTNILKLDVTYNKKNNFPLNNISFDSLYINKKRIEEDDEIDVRLIYVTPHIIFFNYDKGYSTTDIISMKLIENIQDICIIPKFNYRSYDNKSIEFISDDENRWMSYNYVTLKSFCDYHGNNDNYKYSLENFKQFLERIFKTLSETNFIPYLIHPNRLILYKDESLRIISPNILQYIYSPYAKARKIQHVLFSHQRVLLNMMCKNENFLEKMMKDTVDLFLDFFHSSFVTLLWIYNNNIVLMRNINNIFFNDISSNLKIKKRKSNIPNSSNFEQNYFQNLYAEEEEEKENNNNLCKNEYGFCLNYYHNTCLRKLIHNYGCEHLQKIMPIVLDNAIKEANNKNQPNIFISSIQLQFEIFIEFLNELKNIKENDDGNN